MTRLLCLVCHGIQQQWMAAATIVVFCFYFLFIILFTLLSSFVLHRQGTSEIICMISGISGTSRHDPCDQNLKLWCKKMLEVLRDTLYATKFEEDVRLPSLVVEVPFLGCKLGLIGSNPVFWAQLLILVSLQSIVNLVVAIVIYEFIIKNPKQGSWTPYLVGYGIVCPLLFALPFWLVEELDLRNLCMSIGAAASSCLLFFRCFEAMHDTVPLFATKSRTSFLLYYVSTVQFCFDESTGQVERCTWSDIVRKATNFISLFIQSVLMFSLLFPRNYELVTISEGSFLRGIAGHLVNNFAMASLTSICLEVGATGMGLGISIATFVKTVDLNDNPLSKSQSPSEFWNKRWNTLVSNGLKRAVFVPLRKAGYSKPFAALSTFVASGLMHEYLLIILSYYEFKATGQITFSGTHLAFFVWNGVVLILEHYLKDHSVIRWISRTFPPPMKTALVILTVLPLAHLFTKSYADKGFYTSMGIGFPRVLYIS